jgi:hypothetical protein
MEEVPTRLIENCTSYPPYAVWRAIIICYDAIERGPEIDEALFKIFSRLCDAIPDSYNLTRNEFTYQHENWREQQGTLPTVPLYSIIDWKMFMLAVDHQILSVLKDSGHLYELRQQLIDNENNYHGVSRNERRKKSLPLPYEIDETPEELVRIFLKHTPFWPLLHTQVPFVIPRKTFASHGIVLAPPNHGKTQLLGSLISGFLSSPEQPGLFVLDPHGDLYTTLHNRVPQSRLVLLNPDENPPPLNFLDFGTSTEAQTLQTFSYLMSSLSGGLSDKQGAIVPYLLKMLRRLPDASLETLRLIVDEKVKDAQKSVFWPAIASLNSVDQGFFHNQFYSSRMQETKDAIGWKLYSALSSDAFREMFSAKTNSFDADAAMSERKVVLVKGARRSLGDEGMTVFLQFLVGQFFSAALRRERLHPSQRHLCILFADEAHHIFNSQTSNILTECRKYGLGFVAATQVVQQIPEDVKAAIYGATAIKIAGPVSHSDANILAREMYTTPDFIRSMESVESSHAYWAVNVAPNKTSYRVRVPYGSLESMPKDKGPAYQVAEPSHRLKETPAEADTPTIPEPAAIKQQQNELSLRDVDLPLPEIPTKDDEGKGGWETW